MSIDTAAILAARYHSDPSPLKAAVLGQGGADINPYAALRALQLQKEAQRYQMAEAAMRGQQAAQQPSLVQQALQGAQGPMQGLPAMAQQPQPQQMQQPQQPSMGLAGMPAPEGEYAGGGIVAFADEGLVQDELTPGMLEGIEDETAALQGEQASPGAPVSYNAVANMLPGLLQNIQNTRYTAMTPEEYKTAFTARKALLQEGAPNVLPNMERQLAEYDTERQQGLGQAKGLAMLAAAGEALQPGGFARAAGASAKTFAAQYGQALAADKAEQRSLMSMRFNLADAQRKEQMGLNREAIAAADQARADHTAAQRFGLEKNKALATVASGMARATKPTTAGGPKGFDNLAAKYFVADKLENDKLPPEQRKPDAVVEAKSYQRAAADWAKVPAGETIDIKKQDIKVKERGATSEESRARTAQEALEIQRQQAETARQDKIQKAYENWEIMHPTATPSEKEAERRRLEGAYPRPAEKKPAAAAPSEPAYPDQSTSKTSEKAPAKADKSGNKNSQAKPAGGKVVTRADIAATAKASGKTVKEVEAAAKAKGYTIK